MFTRLKIEPKIQLKFMIIKAQKISGGTDSIQTASACADDVEELHIFKGAFHWSSEKRK